MLLDSIGQSTHLLTALLCYNLLDVQSAPQTLAGHCSGHAACQVGVKLTAMSVPQPRYAMHTLTLSALQSTHCGMGPQVRNDLRSQGLEVPEAVARPAASPELALAALREVENQPHAGRQHKVEEPEISDDDEDVEEEGDIGGRYAEEILEVAGV